MSEKKNVFEELCDSVVDSVVSVWDDIMPKKKKRKPQPYRRTTDIKRERIHTHRTTPRPTQQQQQHQQHQETSRPQPPRHQARAAPRQQQQQQPNQSIRSTDSTLLSNLSHIIITETHVLNGDLCSICLDDLEIDDNVLQLPCFHLFHSSCVESWLKTNYICPNCRYEMKSNDTNYERNKELERKAKREAEQNTNIFSIRNIKTNLQSKHIEMSGIVDKKELSELYLSKLTVKEMKKILIDNNIDVSVLLEKDELRKNVRILMNNS